MSRVILKNGLSAMKTVELIPADINHRTSPKRIATLLAQYVRDAQDGVARNGKPVSEIIQELLRHHDPLVKLGALRYMLDVAKLESEHAEPDEGERPIISGEPMTEEQWLQVHSPKK